MKRVIITCYPLYISFIVHNDGGDVLLTGADPLENHDGLYIMGKLLNRLQSMFGLLEIEILEVES